MRLALVAVLGLVLSACSVASDPPHAVDNRLDDLIALAPPGPLEPTPYPTHYALDLKLDPREARFGGTVTITLAVTERTSGVYLHGRDLNIEQKRKTDHLPLGSGCRSWSQVWPGSIFGRQLIPAR